MSSRLEHSAPRRAPSGPPVAPIADTMLEAAPVALYVCDADGGLVRCNQNAIELWGRHPRLGATSERYCGSYRMHRPNGGGLLPRGEHPVAEVLRTGEPVRNREIVIERPDGSRAIALLSVDVLTDFSGAVVGAVAALQDVTELKRIEQELRSGRDQLEDFFENGVIALHWVDADGTILRANRAELELLGYAREEYVGRRISEFHVDRDVIDDILARLSRGEKLDKYQARLRAKDGSIKHVQVSSDARFEGGAFVHTRCFTVDVTDEVRMEEALRESARELARSKEALAQELAATERLQSISAELTGEQGLEGLYAKIVDAATVIMRSQRASMQLLCRDQEDGDQLQLLACRGFNEGAAKHFEWVRADSSCSCGAALRTGARVVVPDVMQCDFMAGSEDLAMSLATGMRAMQTTPLISRSGRLLGMISTHWSEPHDPPEADLRRLDVLARQAADLIERAHAEEGLARLAAIVQSSEDAIIAKDLDGVVRSWNRGAERLFGYAPEEVIGQPIIMLIPEGRRDEEPEILARIRRGERVDHFETVRRHKDGNLVDISLTISPLRDASGKIIGASSIARDITERKKAEESQRLLLREMSHRVKNLFAIASSIVTLSARGARTPEELATTIRERLNALRQAHELVRPNITNGDAISGPTETTLDAMISALFASYATNGKRRILASGPTAPIGSEAATAIALVLHELGTNAVKYGALSAQGGRVEINWSIADGAVRIAWRERGGPPLLGPPAQEGFGTQLVSASITGQLGGEISRRWAPEGLEVDLALPLQKLAA